MNNNKGSDILKFIERGVIMSRTKKHNNKKLNIGFVLLGIQVFASLLFIFFLLRLSLIPTPILLLVGVILLLTVLLN